MSFINRAWGLIEYGGYHLALAKMPSMYEDSSLTAIAFGIAGGLALSEFVSRTLFNTNTHQMIKDFKNDFDEDQIQKVENNLENLTL